MNESVELAPPIRNSLILIGLTLRTFSAVVSDRLAPFVVHAAFPTMSPLNAVGPEVTRNVALTLAPATTEANVCDVLLVPVTTADHPPGSVRLSRTLVAAAPVVLVKVSVTSWLDPGANVCRPVG